MHINELSNILNQHFNFHKARADCIAQIIRAMLTVKTVNFAHLATAFITHVKTESSYKRIQRFFRYFCFEPSSIASMILSLFHLKDKKWVLILDRTNWKLGGSDINILMLSIAYKGISLPLMWSCLSKRGNSNTTERINLIKRILLMIGPQHIECLLGDREFVGADWLAWLEEHGIHFLFRIRNNSLIEGAIPVNEFFKKLSPKRKVKNGKTVLWGIHLYLSTRWSYKGDELVTLISNRKFQDPFQIYRMRWEIETFFGCLKTRGFCLEDTHLTHLKRIERLLSVLVIAFCWSYRVGEEKNLELPIKKKSHGRKAKSIFRYGFDELRGIFLNIQSQADLFFKWIRLLVVDIKEDSMMC